MLDSKGNRVRTVPDGQDRRLRSVPPLDPTTPPSVARIPVRPSSVSGLRPAAKPILASECLRDDIAPLEPFTRVGRVTYALSAAAGATASVMTRSIPLGAAAGMALLGAVLPRYALRAVAAIAGAAIAASTFAGAPTLLLRIVAASLLATSLFLRASYRAHRGTRIALGVGIALFALSALGAGRISGAAIGVVATVSLLGFMNDETTGGCAWWGALAIAVAGGSFALAGAGWIAVATALVAIVCASVGGYQLVAQLIAPTERARDHRSTLPPAAPFNDVE